MTKCSFIDNNTKKEIESSNISTSVKNKFSSIRTCGEVSKFDAAEMIRDCNGVLGSAKLKCVIAKLKGAGLDKDELKDLMLSMREEGAIRMEVGTPLDMTKETEMDYIIDTGKNRFAYARLSRDWIDKNWPSGKFYK